MYLSVIMYLWLLRLKPLLKLPFVLFSIALIPVVVAGEPVLSALTESYRPYSFERSGKVDGMATEVVRRVLAEAKLEANFEMVPWARAYRTAETTPNVLIYSMSRTDEREPLFHWIGVVCPTELSFVRATGADIKPNSLEAAKTFSVAVGRDQYGHKYLAEQGFSNLILTGGSDVNIKMLLNRRVDLIYTDPAWARSYAVELGLDGNGLERVSEMPKEVFNLYLAASKATDMVLVERLQAAYKSIEQVGKVQAIWDRVDEWIK